ncbi:MAG: SH3 domain-containing protein [Faecousia sp.]
MKKRIVCVLLTLIMLVSLVPATALTASAAAMKTSEAAITIMKKLTPFVEECYQVGSTNEFRIGYGTVCSEDGHKVTYKNGKVTIVEGHETHAVTQTQADQALRKVILDLDAKVNSFASSNGLTLSQCQHDALVLFSFNAGDSWMSGSGVVKNAIVSKAGTNDLLNAMANWANDPASLWKRMVEVNMYKNGVYSDVVPSSFGVVTYNANGGTLAQGNGSQYAMLYDITKTVSHIPAPTKSGYVFMGWYTKDSDGKLVPSLTWESNGKTLYANWQSVDVTPNSGAGKMNKITETLVLDQLATKNVYSIPSKDGEVVRRIDPEKETKFNAVRDFIDSNGKRWCKLSGDKEWVLVDSVALDDSGEYTGAKLNVTVTVTNAYVNRRASASASSALTGSYTVGAKLKIVATNDAKTWGQVEENGVTVGWVALMYTNWSTVYDGSAASDANNTTPIATATVTYNGYLNVRSDPGTDNKIVGGYAKDATVNIFEIRTVNGHRWGRTTSGWICLTYTRVVMLTDKAVSDQGALAYAFTGKIVNGPAEFHVEPGYNTNTTGDELDDGTAVTVTNLAAADGRTWGKANWTVEEKDSDGKIKKVAKTGWIPMCGIAADGSAIYGTDGSVMIDPVKFTVVSDELNVRLGFNSSLEFVGSASEFIFKLTKGVEVEVYYVALYGEDIWGYIQGYQNGSLTVYGNGFINLASKYVKRSQEVTIDSGTSEAAIGTGTVVNADSVRVRMTGALYGQPLGSIDRGTRVAVLEEKDGWYRIDYDLDSNPETDSWIYGQYLEVQMGVVDTSGTTGSSGTVQKTDGTGTGIIANTYAGVNVRSGAGIGNGIVGKMLNGTQVEILEVKTVGTAKWGRVTQGWICMDYVTMISYSDIPSGTTGTDSSKGTAVDSFDEVEKTTTTAVYTGYMLKNATVYKTPNPNLEDNEVRTIGSGENITIHELTAVTLEIYEGSKTDKTEDENKVNDVETVVKQTSYWARINDGWVKDPQECIQLNGLDEKVHTVTGASNLNVASAPNDSPTDSTVGALARLRMGDQVPVTELKIYKYAGERKLTVWGRVETSDGIVGYCDLSYMSEGALYEKEEEPTTAPTTPAPIIGSSGNTGDGGFVGTGGYKYTGKVINTSSLNVRVTPSTTAAKATTLKGDANLVIYETKISEDMAWGRCDAGWVYLYYVDMTPASGSAIDARVVFNDNTIIYTDNACSGTAGTYSRMAVIDIYEYVGDMARTDLGWVSTGNLL